MELWGIDNFSNEAARDWLDDFGGNDFRLIDRTLAGIASLLPVDVLDAEEAAEALVSAECIAAARGAPSAHMPQTLTDWLDENPNMQVKPEFVEMAQKAVARVLDDSILRDIWRQTEHFEHWQAVVQDLQLRLMSKV